MMVPLLDPVDGAVGTGTLVTSTLGTGTLGAANLDTNDELVINELWVSFISLLRSHLGALQVSGRMAQAVFSSLSPSSIEVADLSRVMHLSLQSSSGLGEWSMTRLGEMISAGDWVLHVDASVTIDGSAPQDMELAVEELTRKLWAKSSGAKMLNAALAEGT